MILQALYDYAQRKGDSLPEDGFVNIEIKYLIKIKQDGSLVDIISTEEKDAKGKLRGHVYNHVPKPAERTVKKIASLLHDNAKYVLAFDGSEDAIACKDVFIQRIEELPEDVRQKKEIQAILKFYKENKKNGFDKVESTELWKSIQLTDRITFIIENEDDIVPKLDYVCNYQRCIVSSQAELSEESSTGNSVGICMITGEKSVIARLHSSTPIPNSKP